MRRYMIGVIGASNATNAGLMMAREVGDRVARAGAVLVCGGLDGIMLAAAQGCCEAGGDVLGLLPGPDVQEANPYITLAVPTNMGHARNMIIAHTAEVLIAIEGGYGTVCEAAIALKLGKRVLTLGDGLSLSGVEPVLTPKDAVESALQSVVTLRGEGLCTLN